MLCRGSLQPTPAPLPILGLWGCCTSQVAAAGLVLQFACYNIVQHPLHCTRPLPCYQSKGYGGAAPVVGLLQLLCYSYCCSYPGAALVLQRTVANPATLPIQGLWGCSTSATAVVLQLLHFLSCSSSSSTVAHCSSSLLVVVLWGRAQRTPSFPK